jgi:8-oxo-dGTP diphosphatase
MKREYPDQPLVGVGCIIVEDGCVALIKRGHPPLLGEWSIPGGLLELSETVRQGAAREAQEETGLIVEVLELLGVFDRIVRDSDGRTLYHYVLVDFLCRRVSGQLKSAGDADDARWFTPDEVAALPLPNDTAQVIGWGFQRAPR